MIHQNQSQSYSRTDINCGNAFKAQLIRTIPAMPVVIPRRFVGTYGRIKVVRAPHWLSGFVTSPVAAAALAAVSQIDDGAARNIANWSSFLPAN